MPASANITNAATVAFSVPPDRYGFTMTNNSGVTILFRLSGTVSTSGANKGIPITDGQTRTFVFRDPLPSGLQVQAIRESGSDAVTLTYEVMMLPMVVVA